MDVTHNGTAPEGLHGITENIPGNSLDDVFHELWSVAFQPFPFLGSPNALIGHGFPAELIHSNPRLYVGKPPAAGKFDK